MQTLTAFENYLLTLPIRTAVDHIIQCLVSGESDNQAWGFMEEFNGPDWKCKPQDLHNVVGRSLHRLSIKAIVIGGKHA
jgi:hypothetical protein